MLSRYRRRLEIVAEILRIALTGARKTRIMYQCNLSYKLLSRYLEDVVRAELVRSQGEGNGYVTTRKGKQFLAQFGQYVVRSQQVHQQVDEVKSQRHVLEQMAAGRKSARKPSDI